MRGLLTALCRLLLRVFFRRVDSIDAERVPERGPALYVLNHPNALIDPLFILCLSPRPVTFLAKAPLFHTFLVRHFVRAFECLPVYRKQDGADPSKNREIIERSIALLASAKVLALFPEGTSHSEPSLKPFKTGAARIALGASAIQADGSIPEPVQIVPVGLYYAQKTTFRSRAVLVYGELVEAPAVELDASFRAPAEAVAELNARIEAALGAVTLNAEDLEALRLAEQAERILAGAERDAGEDLPRDHPLRSFELKQRLVAGYAQLRAEAPAAVEDLADRVRRYAAQMHMLGLPLDHPAELSRAQVLRYSLEQALVLPLLAGPALIGLVTHYPAYKLIDWLAHRVAKQAEDMLATLKLIAGLLVFPLTWLILAGVTAATLGWLWAGVALLALPACGWAALLMSERIADLLDRARGLWLLRREGIGPALARERREIREAIVALAATLEPPARGP